jgi:hypothetical protein
MQKTFKPSAAALRQAMALARKDGWMEPTGEIRDRDSRTDYGRYFDDVTESWEETDHFNILYGEKIRDIGRADATVQGWDESQEDETLAFHETFYIPLKEAFWEAWAEVHRLDEFWEKNVKKGARA